MSLEQALAENTAALKVLHAALTAGAAATAAKADAKPPKADVPAPAPADTPNPIEQSSDDVFAETTDEEITYEQVRDTLMELNKTKGREVIAALLARLGVQRVPEIEAKMWPEAMKLAKKALAK